FLLLRPSPSSTLFPYTTLFRSAPEHKAMLSDIGLDINRYLAAAGRDFGLYSAMKLETGLFFDKQTWGVDRMVQGYPGPYVTGERSEEHTSELQLRSDLVCRLLL